MLFRASVVAPTIRDTADDIASDWDAVADDL